MFYAIASGIIKVLEQGKAPFLDIYASNENNESSQDHKSEEVSKENQKNEGCG